MAILAVLYHAPVLDHLRPLGFFRNTFVGLEFFFVLSGFVICRAYADRVGSWTQLASFVVRRFGRLWPLHAFVLGLLVLMEIAKLVLVSGLGVSAHQPPFAGERSVASLITNLLMIHSVGVHDRLTWNLPSWTISVEFYTYLVFAAVVSAVAVRRRLAYLAVSVASLGVLAWFWSPAGLDTTYDFGIFRCLSGFFVGCLVASVHARWSQILTSRVAAGLLEVGAVILFVAFVSLVGRHPLSLCSSLVFGAVVMVFSLDRGAVSTLLTARPFQVLGALSYSVYMLHWPLMQAMLQGLRWMEGTAPGSLLRLYVDPAGLESRLLSAGSTWQMDFVTFSLVVASVGASALTCRFVEIPGRKWFAQIARRIEAPSKEREPIVEAS